MAQLVAHLVRDQEVAGSSPVIQTKKSESLRLAFLFFRHLNPVLVQVQNPGSKSNQVVFKSWRVEYYDADAGQIITAFLPSSLSSSLAAYDAMSTLSEDRKNHRYATLLLPFRQNRWLGTVPGQVCSRFGDSARDIIALHLFTQKKTLLWASSLVICLRNGQYHRHTVGKRVFFHMTASEITDWGIWQRT